MMIYDFTFAACMALFGIGTFLFIISGTKDAKNNLKSINKTAKARGNRQKILKQVADYTQFHSNIKRFSNNCSFFVAFPQLIIIS